MDVRRAPNEILVKEQQLEDREEKLAQRAQALVDSVRQLAGRRAAIEPLLADLRAQGGALPEGVDALMDADPLHHSADVAALCAHAESLRAQAAEARRQAVQARDEELTQQAAAVGAVLVGLAKAHKEARSQLDARAVPVRGPRPPSLPPTQSGLNHRVHDRAQLRVQVDFESDHNFFTGFSSDISEGGLFVATVNIQPLGSPVEVAFALPTGEQVVARGVVRWIREASDKDQRVHAGMGIQFERLPDDARDAVQGFISQREPMFFTD